mmetsp:Transcript_58812/g.189135  ORF Transcript_58812/g.189135 Transcript_58812/m.189135 type:complete len:217 (-) Transcript_58812:627-1277(-)
MGSPSPKRAVLSLLPPGNRQGSTSATWIRMSPSLSVRFLRGSRKQPPSPMATALQPLTSTRVPARPRPQHVERSARRRGGTGGRDLKVPTDMGQLSMRCISQPPSSSQRSAKGEGVLAWKEKPAGAFRRKERPARRHGRSCSPASALRARRSGKGPMELPSRVISESKAPGHSITPVAGLASSGTCSLSSATQSRPSAGSSSSPSSPSSSSSGGSQ